MPKKQATSSDVLNTVKSVEQILKDYVQNVLNIKPDFSHAQVQSALGLHPLVKDHFGGILNKVLEILAELGANGGSDEFKKAIKKDIKQCEKDAKEEKHDPERKQNLLNMAKEAKEGFNSVKSCLDTLEKLYGKLLIGSIFRETGKQVKLDEDLANYKDLKVKVE
ncbi:hypothetical protein B0T26DRAFT_678236 [Lasiosphaeria miniovina]|uniref:Uncharacterized protein n=1 Tax=Lasiosphaeria miniovina TaxID=1954250 RepID=A0AA40ADU6_9PEZI|nr:uncharacterized protein B0T26DRAFT_678236 [Lasiosphaeria miniovina]KAK0713964.1 hypothetical protein B0T26DRAFT_678236 [Lasiosphaeria miniovina]